MSGLDCTETQSNVLIKVSLDGSDARDPEAVSGVGRGPPPPPPERFKGFRPP